VLSAIVLQLFPPHDYLQICGCQDFAPAVQTDDNHLATNSLDIIKISVGVQSQNYTPHKLIF
jgi:hypothetical protein